MGRTSYDLSHFVFSVGRIGRLTTLARVPVVAGSSLSIRADGVWRLSPLRRYAVMDPKVDLACFFVPHRHIYGDKWESMVEDGVDESVTLDTTSYADSQNDAPPSYLATPIKDAAGPRWISAGYNRIYNRYYVPPSLRENAAYDHADDHVASDLATRKYGMKVARLKTIWSTPIHTRPTPSDRTVSVTGTTSSGTISGSMSLTDLSYIQGRYKTELDREFFAREYSDIMRRTWGTKVSTDQEQRPTLLARSSWWLGAGDVDGTDDATLGSSTGKANSYGGLNMRSKFFGEHGAVWLLAVFRYPPLFPTEMHGLDAKGQPGYVDITGDPGMLSRTPPQQFKLKDYFYGGQNLVTGYIPAGQYWRTHPNRVHPDYLDVEGFPFVEAPPTTAAAANMESDSDASLDARYATLQLQHWQCQLQVGIRVKSPIPNPVSSIYSGV